MRLGGRLAAAIDVLADIERRHRPVAEALKDWGVSHRFAGAGDRAAIGNIVYGGLRRKRSAGWLFGADTPRAIGFGALALEWRETPASLNAALAGDKFAPPPLDTDEVAAFAASDLENAPAAVRADCPDWCAPHLERAFGDDWVAEAAGLAARPPLDMRVNTLLADRARVVAALEEIGAAVTKLAPNGIRIPPIEAAGRHPNVQAEPAFQQGWFEVQDEGSQVVAELAGATPGMQVLDFCAGAGGKSLALAASMQNSGRLVAHDSDKTRLAPIFDRIRRAEAKNIEVIARRSELAPLEGMMDLVLIDAPCTGSGTWRRRPDAKWRLTQKQLDVRKAEQAAILRDARSYVKPGGRLVYITCSVFREENHDQVQSFLDANPDFAPVDHRALFQATFSGKNDDYRTEPLGVSLSPHLSGTDGFFFAALVRS